MWFGFRNDEYFGVIYKLCSKHKTGGEPVFFVCSFKIEKFKTNFV